MVHAYIPFEVHSEGGRVVRRPATGPHRRSSPAPDAPDAGVRRAPSPQGLCAPSFPGPSPESLRGCPATLSRGDPRPCPPGLGAGGTAPACRVSRGRGTRRPPPSRPRRSRRLCCRSCSGPPADLRGQRTLATQTPPPPQAPPASAPSRLAAFLLLSGFFKKKRAWKVGVFSRQERRRRQDPPHPQAPERILSLCMFFVGGSVLI